MLLYFIFFRTVLLQELSREGARCSSLQAQVSEAAGRREDAARLEVQMAQVQDQLTRLQGEREEQVRQLTDIVATQERHITTLR